jgi:GNAT superfamily N-acetyltransferase
MEQRKGNLLLSTDKARINQAEVLRLLQTETYWAGNMTPEKLATAVANSLCFSVFDADRQVAFARLITDYATFGYLTDVFVVSEYRSKGISKWIMEEMVKMPELQGFRRWVLATTDAHELYRRYGFAEPELLNTYMHRVNPDLYSEGVEE